jgi:2,3-bisphosphoglycerate-dependent phosphoglycerate mutase
VTEVYLVRHADAVWTPDEMRPLSRLGREQADAVAERLAPLAPHAIYSSPWTRARQTVEPLATRLGLAIETVADLRERQLTDREVADFGAASRTTWDDFAHRLPGGESNREAEERGAAALGALVARHAGARIVVATHGTLLALILHAYDPRVGFAFWQRISTPDIYRVEVAASQVTWTRLQDSRRRQ